MSVAVKKTSVALSTRASVELIVDNREHTLIAALNGIAEMTGAPAPTVKTLDVGDIQIHRLTSDGTSSEPYIIIERKTLDDLASSMKSNRYREQKARLLSQRTPTQKIMYLIEGGFSASMGRSFHSGFTEASLLSACTRAMFKDNLLVLQLPTTDALAVWLMATMTKLRANPAEYDGESGVTSMGEYAGLLVSRKRDNVTADVCYRAMLASVPGVTARSADVIAGKWPTMTTLCTHLVTGAAAQKELSEVAIDTTTGKVRKLGPAVADRVVEMLGIPVVKLAPAPTLRVAAPAIGPAVSARRAPDKSVGPKTKAPKASGVKKVGAVADTRTAI